MSGNKQKVEIVIDSNEAAMNESLPEKFVLHEDVSDWKIEPMKEGDIKIDNYLFERKTPEDFASSVMEGRMREQAQRLGDREERAYIVIEGNMSDFSDLEHTNIPPKSLRGMVSSIMARNNIPVVFCSDQVNLADFCVRIARKHKEDANMTFQRSHSDLEKEVDFFERALVQIDGIGPKTAEEITERYDTLVDFLTDSKSSYTKIDGIGKATADSIKEQMGGSTQKREAEVYNI